MNAEHIAPGSTAIRFLTGPLAGQTFPINKSPITIGREGTNDIIVKGDPKVSRSHARIFKNNGTWNIEKLAPQNVLTVNQQQVQQTTISNNSTVGLGEDTSFLFLARADVYMPPVTPQSQPVTSPHQQVTPSQMVGAPPQSSGLILPPPPQPTGPQPNLQPQGAPQPSWKLPPLSAGLSGSPDATQIAPPSALGVPSLEVSSNIHGGRQSYPLTKEVINIGRDATNDISIRDGSIVSGQHLQIIRQGNQFVLIHPHPDKQRTLNGLLYQGRKIQGHEPFRKTLTRGDIFRIGDENGTLITLVFNDGTGTQQEALAPMQPIRLGAPELTIGRVQGNTVVLPHPQVSAHHARLVREGGTYRILDLNSTNHVYVNSEQATSQLLKLGDEIRIGPYKLVYEGNELSQYDESNFIRIDAIDLKKTGNNDVILLNGITLSIPPRKFVALVGGSGAGKSTLMDALNGLRPAHQGKVLYNGQDYYRNLAAFSTQLGYVPQDDIVHRDLTVERALYYAAKMRLPSDFTDIQIKQRINEVLEDVEMTARRKLLVSKLSGGQRKRVSIALELLANPSLFFLDEPTSGLDPGLDRKMMFLLRKLADKGHTIILVTHATNNINTCDYVCFLVKDGRMAFFGPPEEAKRYFGKTDFAEIYTSLEPTEENPHVPADAEARFKGSEDFRKYVQEPLNEGPAGSNAASTNGHLPVKQLKAAKRGNPLTQFILLSTRYIELLKNDLPTLLVLLLQAPIIGLLILLLVRFELGLGANIFAPNNVVSCVPQIFTSTAKGPTNPTGALGLNTGNNNAVDCSRIQNFLRTDAGGQNYVKSKYGDNSDSSVSKAIQDYIRPSSGSAAQTVLFIISFAMVLFGCINGSREIVKEAAIYKRERTVNLGVMPYMFSKLVVLGVLCLIQSAILLLITQAFEPLHQGIFLPVLAETFITLVLTSLVGLLMGLTLSAFAPNNDTATTFIPIILLPQVVFAGAIIPIKDIPLQIMSMIFPTRWAMIALASSIGVHNETTGGDKLFGSDDSYHGTLFSTFSQADATQRLLLTWIALGVIIFVLICIIGFALKRKDVRA